MGKMNKRFMDLHALLDDRGMFVINNTRVLSHQFWNKIIEWPHYDLEDYKVKGAPFMSYKCPKFHPLLCITNYFRVTSHFVTSEPNALKIALNITRWKVPYLSYQNTRVPNSNPFRCTETCYMPFWYKCTKRHLTIRKWPWTIPGQRTSHM